jgi:hypothetical protein
LEVTFYSILVLRSAVATRYLGGLRAFYLAYDPAQQTPELAKLVRMSIDDIEQVLTQLNAAGIVPGEDAAVGDMTRGPLLDCAGVIFERNSELLPNWSARATVPIALSACDGCSASKGPYAGFG